MRRIISAVALIALTAGGELKLEGLKKGFRTIASVLVAQIVSIGVLVTAFFWLISGAVPYIGLPGIAGLILTIGMAVDANVIIFERIKEEIAAGKSPRSAVDAGFDKAAGHGELIEAFPGTVCSRLLGALAIALTQLGVFIVVVNCLKVALRYRQRGAQFTALTKTYRHGQEAQDGGQCGREKGNSQAVY